MTRPQVRVHALAGDVPVDVPGQEPDTTTETTQPMHALTPARLRMLTALCRPSLRLAAGLVVLAALVLLLRGHDDNSATARPTVTATTTVLVDTTSTKTATPSTTTPDPDPAAIAPRPLAEDQLDVLPLAVVGQSLPHAPADPDPDSDPGPEVLHPTSTAAVYDAPGGQPFARLPVRQVFTPTWVPVVQRQPGWARVLVPTRPLDGGIAPTGWLYLDQTVVLSQSMHRVDIDHTTGSATVLARLSRVTTDSGPPDPTSIPITRPRTFMAVTPATVDGGWLARIWQATPDQQRPDLHRHAQNPRDTRPASGLPARAVGRSRMRAYTRWPTQAAVVGHRRNDRAPTLNGTIDPTRPITVPGLRPGRSTGPNTPPEVDTGSPRRHSSR